MENKQEIAHVLLGILGNIATCAFFLSSLPTVLKIIKRRSLGGLSCDLYTFKLFNCLFWTVYGLPIVRPHNFWVLLTNSIGCVLSLIYLSSYLYIGSTRERWSIIWKLVVLSSSFIIVVVVLFLVEHTRHIRITVIGIFCATISSCMHLTLLSQLRMTLTTNKSKYLQPKASATAFMKGAIWTAYGIVNFDIYIVIPNGVAIATGFVQLVAGVYLILNTQKGKQEEQLIPTIVISNPKSLEEPMQTKSTTALVGNARETTTNKEDPAIQHHFETWVPSNVQVRGVVFPIDGLDV